MTRKDSHVFFVHHTQHATHVTWHHTTWIVCFVLNQRMLSRRSRRTQLTWDDLKVQPTPTPTPAPTPVALTTGKDKEDEVEPDSPPAQRGGGGHGHSHGGGGGGHGHSHGDGGGCKHSHGGRGRGKEYLGPDGPELGDDVPHEIQFAPSRHYKYAKSATGKQMTMLSAVVYLGTLLAWVTMGEEYPGPTGFGRNWVGRPAGYVFVGLMINNLLLRVISYRLRYFPDPGVMYNVITQDVLVSADSKSNRFDLAPPLGVADSMDVVHYQYIMRELNSKRRDSEYYTLILSSTILVWSLWSYFDGTLNNPYLSPGYLASAIIFVGLGMVYRAFVHHWYPSFVEKLLDTENFSRLCYIGMEWEFIDLPRPSAVLIRSIPPAPLPTQSV